ncbi:hypothetical protein AAVH_24806, partial [Aphelenchoides avenae]
VVILIAMLIAIAVAHGDDGDLDVAACVRIFRGICKGNDVEHGGLLDAAKCTLACGGLPHVGVCLAIPQLELGAEVCVCIS